MYYFQENNYELAKTLSKEREDNAQVAHVKALYSSYDLLKQKYKCYINQTQEVLGNLDKRVQLGLKHLANAMEVLVDVVGSIEHQQQHNSSLLHMDENEFDTADMNNMASKTLMKVNPMVGGHLIKKASISLQRVVIPEAPGTRVNEVHLHTRLSNIEEVDDTLVEDNLNRNDTPTANNSPMNETDNYSQLNGTGENMSSMNVDQPEILHENDHSINSSGCEISIVRNLPTYPTVCLERLREFPRVTTESSAENVLNIKEKWNADLIPPLVNAVNTRIPLVSLENCASTEVDTCAPNKLSHKSSNGNNYLLVQSHEVNRKLTPVVTLEDIRKTTFSASVLGFNSNLDLVPSRVVERTPLVCLENCIKVEVGALASSTSASNNNSCDKVLSPKLTPVVTLEDIGKTNSIPSHQKRGKAVRQLKEKTSAPARRQQDHSVLSTIQQKEKDIVHEKTSTLSVDEHSVLSTIQQQEKDIVHEKTSTLSVDQHYLVMCTDNQKRKDMHLLESCTKTPATPEVPTEVCLSRKRSILEEEDPLEGPSWKFENMSRNHLTRGMSYEKNKRNSSKPPCLYICNSSDESDSSQVLQTRKKKKKFNSPKKTYQRKCEEQSPISEMGTPIKITPNRAGIISHENGPYEKTCEKKGG